MNIALISDIHGNEHALHRALTAAKAAHCRCLICLGDFGSVAQLRDLRASWDGEIHIVLGNNDWPQERYLSEARLWESGSCQADWDERSIAGRQIYFTHYPELAERAAESGRYDAVFYGHTHDAEQHRGFPHDTLVANPGELQGRSGRCHWAIYHTDDNSLRHQPID